MKYLLVFNPKAKRYSPLVEVMIVQQATRLLRGSTIAVTHTVPQAEGSGYVIADFMRHCQDVDCVVAVGGDGTVNIVVSALARQKLHTQVRLGVIPLGTGNNLVRSFGLRRHSQQAIETLRQGYTTPLDIGVINQTYYCVNASFGLFPYLLARRVTNSLMGYTFEALRHIRFTPWPMRIRYRDAAGHLVELLSQRYIVGAMLNTSHYGSILHMAPDVVSDDGLFDVKLIHQAPLLAYPLLFTVILTGQYDLSRNTTTFRATQLELCPEAPCLFETDGDPIPPQPQYCVRIAGRVQLIVPPPHEALHTPW